ncbi:MAG TPA: heptaprenyl diphosphate synthase component 1 [Bacillus sp. (in: firmicutes)]|nr:heptaprenyl diphosphate synthase component 1 [Bacillus sp. (in: firmicutes)]
MIVQNIIDMVAEVKEQLQLELNHPYVKQFVHHPMIDEDKLLYLCSFLQHISVEEEQLRVYVVSVMLVQIALDTHDLVSIKPVKNDHQLLQERQLTVLAGLYYSSLYYNYLSKNGSLQLINETASAIKNINVEKMKYYKRQFQSADDVMQSLFVIETALIESVCSHFKEEEWKLLLTHAAFVKRLIYEKRIHINYGTSKLFDQLKSCLSIHTNDECQNVMETVEKYINESRKTMEHLSSSLYLNEELKMNLDELIKST